jgi:putative redox protein
MRVELKRVDKDFHFEAQGSTGVAVHIDAAASIGGHNAGARPMELLLMGVGSCSAVDIIQILRKQKQDLQDIRIVIEGTRAHGQIPSVFKEINMHFIVIGNVSETKLKRAISLSIEKYCSASAMLGKTAKISCSCEIKQQVI